MRRLVRAALVVGLVAFGCDSSDSSGDSKTTEDVKTSDDAADGTAGTDNIATGPCSDLDFSGGASFRVTKLLGIKPTDLVNPVWAKDISTYDLVLLMRITEHDKATGKLTMAMTSAKAQVATDGDGNVTPVSYTYALEPSTFEVKMKGCEFFIEEPIALSIMAPTVSKPFYIFGVTGSGKFAEDGMSISNVRLKGAISEEEATDLCMLVPGLSEVNFHWFMNTAGICPLFDSDDDGTADSYEFEGYLNAVQETDLHNLEGIDPMDSLVETCTPNTDPCKPK